MKWASVDVPNSRPFLVFLYLAVVRRQSDASVGRSFVKSPQSIITPPGDSVNFECETDPPADKYTWMRNGETLENDTNTRILAGSLNIKFGLHFVEYEKQRGAYQCVAWFGSSGLASVAGVLDLAQLLPFPSRLGPESKLAVIEGNTAVIKCQSPYSKPPATISFYRDGSLVVPDGERVLIMDSGNLLIYDVRTNDSGAYICSAQNHITNQVQVANVNTTLRVVSTRVPTGAAFKVRPASRNPVVRGANLTLECIAVGNPPPAVNWKKYGGKLDLSRHVLLRSNLKLVNVQKADEGSYVCHAQNNQSEPVEAAAVVEFQEPPNIVEGPSETSALEGSESVMTCSAKGRPAPSIEWLFNGRNAKEVPGIRASGNRLSINRVRKEHAGIFQCFAKNAHGVDTASAFLFVQPRSVTSSRNPDKSSGGNNKEKGGRGRGGGGGNRKNKWRKPSGGRKRPSSGPDVSLDAMEPPSRPNVTRLTDDSVMLTWEMPRQLGPLLPIQFFKIQYKAIRRRAPWRTLDEEIPPHIRSYAVPSLENGQRYKFRILAAYANNDHSVGPTSRKFLLEPDSSDDRPIRAPKIVDTGPEGVDGLSVTWEYGESNVHIEGFFIYYRSTTSAGDYQKVNVLGADVRSHVIRHLESGTTYDLKIQAFNIGGTSGFSNLITAKTRDAEGGKDAGSPDGRRDESRGGSLFGSAGDGNATAEIFGLPKEFPLYAIVIAVVSALVVLLTVPCVVCYCRNEIRPRSARSVDGGAKFPDTALRLSEEAERQKNTFEMRRTGHGPNGAGVSGTANGIRPVSTVGFPVSPVSPPPSSSVSASCDRLPAGRHSFTLDRGDRLNGRQETSFMLVPGTARVASLPHPIRQESCSTFLPGSKRGSGTLRASADSSHLVAGGRSAGDFRASPTSAAGVAGGGGGGEEVWEPHVQAHPAAGSRRRDWRVVDSSPSEIEASWASQQLLSPPTVTAGDDDGEEEPSSPTGYEPHGGGVVVLRRGGGERRSSNPIRPTSWKNDRRRSRDSVRLKREEVS